MKGITNNNPTSRGIKKEPYDPQPSIKSFNISGDLSKSQSLNQRQTPPLFQYKSLQKPDTVKWMKCFNFGKRLDEPEKVHKHHKKQKSADLVYLTAKQQIIQKSQYCVSSLSHFPKKNNKKKEILDLKIKNTKDKDKKHRKRKSADISVKKSSFVKKKNKPLTYDFFRSSKLASLKSVDCSLVDSTKQQEFECNFTQNLYYQVQPEQYPFYSEEIKKYEELYNRKKKSKIIEIDEECPVSHTEHLIKKYIGKTHYESIDFERESERSFQRSSSSNKIIIDISPINEKRQEEDSKQMKKVLMNKVEDMLKVIQDKKQQVSESASNEISYGSGQSKAQLKSINVIKFDQIFSERMRDLNEKRTSQLSKLQDKLEVGVLEEKQFVEERRKINKWTNYEIQNTEKVKTVLKIGVKNALKILSKVQTQIEWSQAERPKLNRKNYFCKSSNVLKLVQKKQDQVKKNSYLKLEQKQQRMNDDFFKLKKISEPEIKPVQVEEERKKQFSKDLIEDVFEYIFIDICLQMFQQMAPEKIKNGLIVDNRNKKKGFDCGKRYVLAFMREFINYVRNDSDVCQKMNKALRKPIGPSPYEMLKYMREENEQIDSIEEMQRNNEEVSYVFNFQWFQKFSKYHIEHYEFEQYFSDSQKQEKRVIFLRHALHFHNKAIFDCLNEHIDKHRPYGLFGIPFPWKNKPILVHHYSEEYVADILNKAATDVNDCCLYLCGVIIDKQNNQFSNYSLSQREVNEIREDRMSRLLCSDLAQNESRWLFFDDEQTEILVNISNFVSQILLKEVGEQLLYIIQKG